MTSTVHGNSLSEAAIHVGKNTGIVDTLADSGLSVTVEGLTLVIDAETRQQISVYGINSLKVADISVSAGRSIVTLPAPGIYLVVSNSGLSAKFIVR